jgi:hypothetical protein
MIAALKLGESNDMRDMHNGWKWLTARNVSVREYYLTLEFAFYNNLLRAITLVISSEKSSQLPSWKNWSEHTEMQKLSKLKQWLQEELGQEGMFDWGNVTANYDYKSGGSSIIINYE